VRLRNAEGTSKFIRNSASEDAGAAGGMRREGEGTGCIDSYQWMDPSTTQTINASDRQLKFQS
jgi:hypothetical protein